MNIISIHKIEQQRRLCIQKDLNELNFWMNTLEFFNNELDHFNIIEKQLIHDSSVASTIQAIRRKNILSMAAFCKYEQELKVEYEYGKVEYDMARLKVHLLKRDSYLQLIQDCNSFKNQFYLQLRKYKRK